MVRVMIEMPSESEACKEFAIVELQGDLETRHPVPLSGKFIGDLHFTNKDVPVLIIGHHILHGKVVNLEKPLGVLAKATATSSKMDTGEDAHSQHQDQEGLGHHATHTVQAVIRKKLVFKTRPKPIIAHVPKKI